ncbi:MAG TPA: hydroxyisourate hydrolase [Vicinamibacterales bacterium]
MTISTHVLDTSVGRPAASVTVQLQRQNGATWIDVSRSVTDSDGRVTGLLPAAGQAGAGGYRLTFDVAEYFRARGVESFYSTVSIDFVVRDGAAHYHVPLLLSPYGYSTYRGS